jgi:hypothetical protein
LEVLKITRMHKVMEFPETQDKAMKFLGFLK